MLKEIGYIHNIKQSYIGFVVFIYIFFFNLRKKNVESDKNLLKLKVE